MKLVFAFIKDKPLLLNKIKNSLNNQGAFLLLAPVLLKDESYTDRLKGISQDKEELETMLSKAFPHVELITEQYFETNGLEAVYLAHK